STPTLRSRYERDRRFLFPGRAAPCVKEGFSEVEWRSRVREGFVPSADVGHFGTICAVSGALRRRGMINFLPGYPAACEPCVRRSRTIHDGYDQHAARFYSSG
ncbi:unnamed protein product, partial [Scytosiphon promiscuus]